MDLTSGQHCVIAEDAEIGDSTRIGNFVLIRDRTVIGRSCVIGSYVDIEGEVRIGHFVSLQSRCYITRGVIIEDEVFCGPGILTMNDKRIAHRRPSLTFDRRAPRFTVLIVARFFAVRFFAGPRAARSARSSTACPRSIDSGSTPRGTVALISPSVTSVLVTANEATLGSRG